MDPDHVRMIHGSELPRLSGIINCGAVETCGLNLDGHGTVQLAVSAGPHLPKRTLTEDRANLIAG